MHYWFNEFDNALSRLDKIREKKISQLNQKNDQIEFKSNLVEINKIEKNRSKEQMLYKARNNVIKFFDEYTSMISEANHEGFKMLTPKQML